MEFDIFKRNSREQRL